jgi:hypothetical protein
MEEDAEYGEMIKEPTEIKRLLFQSTRFKSLVMGRPHPKDGSLRRKYCRISRTASNQTEATYLLEPKFPKR